MVTMQIHGLHGENWMHNINQNDKTTETIFPERDESFITIGIK